MVGEPVVGAGFLTEGPIELRRIQELSTATLTIIAPSQLLWVSVFLRFELRPLHRAAHISAERYPLPLEPNAKSALIINEASILHSAMMT